MKRPSFQFYPGDWLRDAALRSCSLGARGLWIDMMCLMHQGTPYGKLKVNSKVISTTQLGRIVGGEENEIKKWLQELIEAGVSSIDENGCFYSKRMIKDEELREIRAAGGKEGGNPNLIENYNKPGFVYAMLRESDRWVKIGISQDPSKRLYKVKAQYPSDTIKVIGKKWVEDMGQEEAHLHEFYKDWKCGEWFNIGPEQLDFLLNVHLDNKVKEKPKVNSTPSSSSSFSSSSSDSISNSDSSLRSNPLSSKLDVSVSEIFDFWKITLNHPKAILDKKRKTLIEARLKEGYTVERIKAAVLGITRSPHHMGENDRHTVYDDLELICRTGANIDKFADLRKADPHAKVKRDMRAIFIGEHKEAVNDQG